MSDPEMIAGIQHAVSIPVMAKARIGHFVEAQVLQALEVDYVDESEVLTPAGRASPHRQVAIQGPVRMRRHEPRRGVAPVGEGAAMIRSKGEAGTGDIVEAVRHMRAINGEIRRSTTLDDDDSQAPAKDLGTPRASCGRLLSRAPAGGAVLRGRHRHPR